MPDWGVGGSFNPILTLVFNPSSFLMLYARFWTALYLSNICLGVYLITLWSFLVIALVWLKTMSTSLSLLNSTYSTFQFSLAVGNIDWETWFPQTLHSPFQIYDILARVGWVSSMQCHSKLPLPPKITKQTIHQLPTDQIWPLSSCTSTFLGGWGW